MGSEVDENFFYCVFCLKQLMYRSGGFQASIQHSEKPKRASVSDATLSQQSQLPS